MFDSTDAVTRAIERMRRRRRRDQLTRRTPNELVAHPAAPDPKPVVIEIDDRTQIECDRRPYPGEILRGTADHPPRLEFTIAGTPVVIQLADHMSAARVRNLISHLRPAVWWWLDDAAAYAHDTEMREASADLPASGWEVSQ